jgi:hypothetical protein
VEKLFDHREHDYVYHLAAEYGRWNGEDYYENLWVTTSPARNTSCVCRRKRAFD